MEMKLKLQIFMYDKKHIRLFLDKRGFLIHVFNNMIFCNGACNDSNSNYVIAGNICRRLKMKGYM